MHVARGSLAEMRACRSDGRCDVRTAYSVYCTSLDAMLDGGVQRVARPEELGEILLEIDNGARRVGRARAALARQGVQTRQRA